MEFKNFKEASKSPLAKNLFLVEGITNIYYGKDFITINKQNEVDWELLKPSIFNTIMEFYTSGQEIIQEPVASSTTINEDDDDVVVQIKEILETRIRPAVQDDGGDIHFVVRF